MRIFKQQPTKERAIPYNKSINFSPSAIESILPPPMSMILLIEEKS